MRQDGGGLDISNAWQLDVSVHFIRKISYRGSRSQVCKNRLRLSFDGLTFPAAIFTAASLKVRIHALRACRHDSATSLSQVANVLQTQGCKPVLQQTALAALQTLFFSCTPPAFDVALVPDLEDGAWASMRGEPLLPSPIHNMRSATDSQPSSQTVMLAIFPAALQPHSQATSANTHGRHASGAPCMPW